MPRSRIRLLLILTVAAGLGDLALIGRSRTKPTLQPRPADATSTGTPPASPLAKGGTAPGGYNRYTPPQQHEQETTIRPQAPATSAPLPTARAVEAVQRDQLIQLVEEAISKTSRRYLDVADYTPWQIMHGVLALRSDYKVKSNGRLVSGIEFVSSGPKFRGDYWWEKTAAGGRGHPYSVPYHFEGHINQFPALLCMAALPLDHKLVAKGGDITIADMVRNAQRTVNTSEEISWTLWFLTQYVNQDAEWTNQNGQRWSMQELVRLQVAADVNSGPCGGTHGLFALAFSRNAYLRQHGQLRGPYVNSEYKLRTHIELARNLQNADGSFSTNWFKGKGYTNDFKERIKTSGHMLEWLMMALPSSRLDEAWVRRGIQNVANDLLKNATAPAECGPMYHALHALVLYKERVAPKSTPAPSQELAANPAPATPSATLPRVASGLPATPTDASLLPPLPAQSTARPGVPAAIAAPATTAQPTTPTAPTAPGIVQISPAAPASTAATPRPAIPTSPLPLVSSAGAPGMIAPSGAKPLVISSEELPPSVTTTPPAAGSPSQIPLRVMDSPQPTLTQSTPPSPAPATTPALPANAAPSVSQRLPAELASQPPADLPPAIVAVDPHPPRDLPVNAAAPTPALETAVVQTPSIPLIAPPAPNLTTLPSTLPGSPSMPSAVVTERPATAAPAIAQPDSTPILPPVALDTPVPAPAGDQPVTGLTIQPENPPGGQKPAGKPEIDATPVAPVKVATQPAATPSDTQ